MEKLTRILLLLFLLFSDHIQAQKLFTLNDLIPGGRTYNRFVPKSLQLLQWRGDEYVYRKNADTLLSVNPATQKVSVLITTAILNEALLTVNVARIGEIPLLYFPPEKPSVAVFWHDGHIFHFDANARCIVSDIREQETWENREICYQTGFMAFTKDNNLYMASPTNEIIQVTAESNPDIVCGQATHREEFGIEKGIFWSPGGKRLAFYRTDQTMVADYPLVDVSERIARLQRIKYPMAGMESHQVTVGIFDLATRTTHYLETGTPKDRYFTNIAWSADEDTLYIAEVNRGQDTCRLNAYSVANGIKTATLFEETHPKYVEPHNPPVFLKSGHFIWQSRRDGFNHLYLYQSDGRLVRQLTSGKWEVVQLIAFDENEQEAFFLSNEESPLQTHAYKVNLTDCRRTRLTNEEGKHAIMVSASGKYVLSRYSNPQTPAHTVLIETASGKTTSLLTDNPYSGYILPDISVGTIKAADDSTDVYYRMVKPADFDASRKYPAIIYVYGGPQNQLISNSWLWGARGWDIYMAQRGFVVFSLDNRGSSGRGLAFENVIFRRLGVNETEDQMKGVEFLQSLPYIDSARIGVHGWSFGGFMTIGLMLRHPDVFKAGVAGGPVIDWKYYEVMYGERYMDTPAENPDGYAETNLNLRAGNLKGNLLLIHGDMDSTVVLQHSLSFLKACIEAGTYPDFFIYPGHEHNVHGQDRVHLHEKISQYIETTLK
ncbi:MAG: S9 family peptidase [Bacteroidales bacterium]|jgi:dipeptidyl-peptidase-4|nr:S9 family peptidase [Bacteroidales bacterium]